MVLAEAYFDESCTNGQDVVQSISGYLFETKAAQSLSRCWVNTLRKYELPYFHTVECAHRSKTFQKYRDSDDKNTPSMIAREFIDLIKAHGPLGISVMFNPLSFRGAGEDEYMKRYNDLYVQAVSIAAKFSMSFLINEAKISMTLEAGHASQGLAQQALNDFRQNDINKERVLNASFESKVNSPLLQAADILAWQSTTYVKGWRNGREIRKDFASLLEVPHTFFHVETAALSLLKPDGGMTRQNVLNTYAGTPRKSPMWDAVLDRVYGRADEIRFSLPMISSLIPEGGPPILKLIPVD